MSKRMELLAGAIALGVMLNAAVGFYRILEPESATAQAAITDVNLVQVNGNPVDFIKFTDGTAAPTVVVNAAVNGNEKFPFYVKIAP